MRFTKSVTIVCLLLIFFALPQAAQAQGFLEPADFEVKGIALGATKEQMLAVFGKPDFHKERVVWDVLVRYYVFSKGYEVGVAVATGQVVDILVRDAYYKARAGVRHGATAYKIQTTFGKKQRTFLDGDVCYIYENPQDKKKRLIITVEPTNGSLCSWRITSLPLTEDEADALTDEEKSDVKSHDSCALSLLDKDIDQSALLESKEPVLRVSDRK